MVVDTDLDKSQMDEEDSYHVPDPGRSWRNVVTSSTTSFQLNLKEK